MQVETTWSDKPGAVRRAGISETAGARLRTEYSDRASRAGLSAKTPPSQRNEAYVTVLLKPIAPARIWKEQPIRHCRPTGRDFLPSFVALSPRFDALLYGVQEACTLSSRCTPGRPPLGVGRLRRAEKRAKSYRTLRIAVRRRGRPRIVLDLTSVAMHLLIAPPRKPSGFGSDRVSGSPNRLVVGTSGRELEQPSRNKRATCTGADHVETPFGRIKAGTRWRQLCSLRESRSGRATMRCKPC